MELSSLPFPPLPSTEGRSPGLHLSTILKSILTTMDPQRFGGEITTEAIARFEAGFAFEEAVSNALATRLYRRVARKGGVLLQHELEHEGVYGTPDIIFLSDYSIGEVKFTFMSPGPLYNKDDSQCQCLMDKKFWHWNFQVKCYLRMLGRAHSAAFYILFARGDYKSNDVIKHAHRVTYTDIELEEAWMAAKNHAKGKGWLRV